MGRDQLENREVLCNLCGRTSPIYRDKETENAYCAFCQFPIRNRDSVALDDRELAKFVDISIRPIVALFWAPYSAESREFLSIFDMVATELETKAVLVSVDISINPEAKYRWGIQVLPTIIIIDKGQEVNRVLGALSRFDLEWLIKNGAI